MSDRGQRVLLTGGAGFIGSHLAEALLRRGSQLVVVDNLDSFYPSTWKKANLEEIRRAGTYEFHAVDICEMEQLGQVVARTRPEVIIHLAARAGVRPSIEQPCLYERVNVAGTLNLLELCRQFRVNKFIFGSSSSVYGATPWGGSPPRPLCQKICYSDCTENCPLSPLRAPRRFRNPKIGQQLGAQPTPRFRGMLDARSMHYSMHYSMHCSTHCRPSLFAAHRP